MNKGLQIFLLVLLFGACTAVGYVIGGAIFDNGDTMPAVEKVEPVVEEVEPVVEEVVVPEEEVSTTPEIISISTPKRSNDNTYSFEVEAYVESKDDIVYELYKDSGCTKEVTKNLDGKFSNIASSTNGKYYLRVANLTTHDYSEVREVKGFVYVQMYERITAAEIEKVVNVDRNWSDAPQSLVDRISNNLKVTVVNLRADENAVSNMSEICQKTMYDTWKSIKVEHMSYDGQNRLTHINIRVNY